MTTGSKAVVVTEDDDPLASERLDTPWTYTATGGEVDRWRVGHRCSSGCDKGGDRRGLRRWSQKGGSTGGRLPCRVAHGDVMAGAGVRRHSIPHLFMLNTECVGSDRGTSSKFRDAGIDYLASMFTQSFARVVANRDSSG